MAHSSIMPFPSAALVFRGGSWWRIPSGHRAVQAEFCCTERFQGSVYGQTEEAPSVFIILRFEMKINSFFRFLAKMEIRICTHNCLTQSGWGFFRPAA